ncbi:hypothetical protein [Kitasatospora camelliae]|uniref:Uncharacterized protein n=1 Tax=Kitasatospora camelliae TaxID=3156397 RepID=A0AAU8JPU4_9ACTN
MGLSISVGLLDDLHRHDPEGAAHHARELAVLGDALGRAGIDWREPAAEGTGRAAFSGGFPYGYLHHLRRVYVLRRAGSPVTPAAATDPEQYARDQAEVGEETLMFSSHLLCHADSAGFYIPVDLADPLFLPPDSPVAGGGIVGSSGGLLAELRRLAEAIDLDPDGSDTGAAADDPFEAEKFAWHRLAGACRTSLATGRAIVFH